LVGLNFSLLADRIFAHIERSGQLTSAFETIVQQGPEED